MSKTTNMITAASSITDKQILSVLDMCDASDTALERFVFQALNSDGIFTPGEVLAGRLACAAALCASA